MIANEDIKKLKTIFSTKDDLKNELKAYATKDEMKKAFQTNTQIIVGEIKKVIDTMGVILKKFDNNRGETGEVLDDHEKRIDMLERKIVLT